MNIWKRIASQFGNPRGLPGYLADYIMANRRSNIERSYWAISLLNILPSDNVLEIGFGPGVALKKMSEIVTKGTVWGIDHSDLMFRQALKRNRTGVSKGKVKLIPASVSVFPDIKKTFDKILSVNSFQFWDNPLNDLKKLRTKLRPGGTIAVAYQPRKPGSEDIDAVKAAKRIGEYMEKAGFYNIKIEQKAMKPAAVVCVLGTNRVL